ncbi:hypothetical protein SEA_NANOSMITE_89 [Mycobacterium phage Nanosmite]|nr:hypothetical protein SEA_NANOSMITE_89 [Mycobacterium phage Nanosmite]
MSYRSGTFILISAEGRVFGLYGSMPPAKGIRTSVLKGKGSIYEIVTEPGWEPRLELVDSQ